MSVEKRFQVRNSQKYYGKYVVVDIQTGEVWSFHNLASARAWAKEENKEVDNT